MGPTLMPRYARERTTSVQSLNSFLVRWYLLGVPRQATSGMSTSPALATLAEGLKWYDDAHQSIHDIMWVSPLPRLVLCAELGSLDGDMQTLVYENYNKFISATDTIRQMKSKVHTFIRPLKFLFCILLIHTGNSG